MGINKFGMGYLGQTHPNGLWVVHRAEVGLSKSVTLRRKGTKNISDDFFVHLQMSQNLDFFLTKNAHTWVLNLLLLPYYAHIRI